MGGHNNIPLQSAWLNGSMRYAPGELFGTEYFVDGVSGNDGNDGLSWSTAVAKIEQAITLSNTYIAIAANANKRNKIYLGGGAFSETLDTLPNQCDVIGVGSRTAWKPLILGVTKVTTAVNSCHFYDLGFYQTTAAPTVTIPVGSHGYGFHNCDFTYAGSATHALQVNGGNNGQIMDCHFSGDDPFPIGIHLTGYCSNTRIERNFINCEDDGILLAAMEYTDWALLIKDNVICRCSHDQHDQLSDGIHFEGGESKAMVVHNFISAEDAIRTSGTFTDDRHQYMMIANYINEGTSATTEDKFADVSS